MNDQIICIEDKLPLVMVVIFFIMVFLVRDGTKYENFTTFSKTQNLGKEEGEVFKQGLNKDAKIVYSKLSKIDFPNVDESKKEVNKILEHQSKNDLHDHKVQALKQLDFADDFNRLKVSFKDRRSLMKYIHEYADPITMKLKVHYDRIRPSKFDKRVKEIIKLPDHPSYPSGHACQSYSIAYLLSLKYPKNEKFYLNYAKSVSENREIMGLHYPSDSEYGRKIAEEMVKLSGYRL